MYLKLSKPDKVKCDLELVFNCPLVLQIAVKDPSVFSQRRVGALRGQKKRHQQGSSFKQLQAASSNASYTRFKKWTEANPNVAGRPRLTARVC